MDIVVKAKDGTSQEESLCNVHEDTTGDILFVDSLVCCKCNAADDQQHCTEQLDSQFTLHKTIQNVMTSLLKSLLKSLSKSPFQFWIDSSAQSLLMPPDM